MIRQVATRAHERSVALPGVPLHGNVIEGDTAGWLPTGPFYFKRSGPFVIVVNGDVPAGEAQSLLASVNYDADVTWNQPTKPNPRDDVPRFIIALVVLVGMMILIALILGIAFGGIRVWIKNHYPNSIFDRPENIEIIQLNLK